MPLLAIPWVLGAAGVGYVSGSWASNGWIKAAFWLAVLIVAFLVLKRVGVVK